MHATSLYIQQRKSPEFWNTKWSKEGTRFHSFGKIIYFLQIPHRAKEHFGSHFQSEVHFELKWQWLSISIENWQLGWKVANEDVASSISFEPHQIANVGDRPVVVFPAYNRYEYRVIQKFKLILYFCWFFGRLKVSVILLEYSTFEGFFSYFHGQKCWCLLKVYFFWPKYTINC